MSNVDKWIEQLKDRECIKESELRILCELLQDILIEQSNVQPVSTPVTICGDIHGQFFDLLQLFRQGGEVPSTNYIFIGDFVDRGYNSVQTISLLFCLQLKYPGDITLLRGNHQSRSITKDYGFYDEVYQQYGNENPWKYFTDVFDYLSLGALIQGKILCIHGGLSPSIQTIDQIRLIERNVDIPSEGAFCDLMWSDPDDVETWAVSSRGAGWLFGWQPTREFCQINDIDLICRAHQLVQEGYKYWFSDNNLLSVWSAPNYVNRMNNIAAIAAVDQEMQITLKTFTAVAESSKGVPHKYTLPYFL